MISFHPHPHIYFNFILPLLLFVSRWLFDVCISQIARIFNSLYHFVFFGMKVKPPWNKIIPLKMKNESCVRCKNWDCVLLFHYWLFNNDLQLMCMYIILSSIWSTYEFNYQLQCNFCIQLSSNFHCSSFLWNMQLEEWLILAGLGLFGATTLNLQHRNIVLERLVVDHVNISWIWIISINTHIQ